MAKPPKKSISQLEPADRPVTIAVSIGELLALRDHHMKIMKKLPVILGKEMMAMGNRDRNHFVTQAKKCLDAHAGRAKGLEALIREHL